MSNVKCNVWDCESFDCGECTAETVELEGGICIDYKKDDSSELVYPEGTGE